MAKDLAVALGTDRPGRLAAACEALGAAGVNIQGLCEVEGTLHVLVENLPKARAAAEKAGFRAKAEPDVVIRKLANRPGQAGRFLKKLAEADVNVRFAYLASGVRLVVGVNNLARARKAARAG